MPATHKITALIHAIQRKMSRRGTAYLRELLIIRWPIHGRAAGRHNAGPGAVDPLQRRPTYAETQTYVERYCGSTRARPIQASSSLLEESPIELGRHDESLLRQSH